MRPVRSALATSTRRALAIAVGFGLLMLAPVGAALADPAVPTEYESRITGIEPSTDAAKLNVVGGDSFIEITVEPGHSVAVAGYFGEPYLEIDPVGTVSINQRSPSRYVNDDRFGNTPVPESATADAEPLWEVVATGGRYAWHDHRTHWMATDRPPGIAGDVIQQVFAWELPIVIDGADHTVIGSLDWHPSPNAALPFFGSIVVLLPLTRWRRGRIRLLAVMISIAALVALALSLFQWLATPTVARPFPTAALPPVVAVVLGTMAVRRAAANPVAAVESVVVAAVALVVFGFASLDVLTKPLLPSFLPDGFERLATSGVIWAAVACGVLSAAHMVRIASGSNTVDEITRLARESES